MRVRALARVARAASEARGRARDHRARSSARRAVAARVSDARGDDVERERWLARALEEDETELAVTREGERAGADAVDGALVDGALDWTRASGGRTLEPGLFLVATPIGNLEDVTLRALRVLRDADAVLAEDTRVTRNLLRAYGIATPLVSYHAHNEARRREGALARLASGGSLALVSDAGMPTVNDPGRDLAASAAAIGVRVIPVPGPSAVLASLAGAGLPTDEFTFIGFPPPKSAARVKRFKSFARANATLVMFVPPHKLLGSIEDAITALGDRRCAVCRELTKVHEEFWRGTLSEAKAEFERRAPRGEITMVIEGFQGDDRRASTSGDDDEEDVDATSSVASVEDALRELLSAGVSPSEASRRVAKDLGVRRRETYGVAQRLSEELKR